MDWSRTARLWDLLVEKAPRGQAITYSEAAVHVGGIARGLGALLQPIQHYCRDHGLPNLCVLVVKSDTRKPGGGFVGDPGEELRRVREYAWKNTGNPFERGEKL